MKRTRRFSFRAVCLTTLALGWACNTRSTASEPTPAPAPTHTPLRGPSAAHTSSGPIAITVDAEGYHPAEVHAAAGKPARLTFTRTSDEGCGQQLVFPKLGINKDLPLNQPVSVDLTLPTSGTISFTCGMGMLRGSVVAE